MENSLYVGLSSQVALWENMSIIANNVANINTPGFRGQNMIFEEFVHDAGRRQHDVSLVNDYGQYQITDPGPMKETGNQLDVALIGPGFLGIQTPDGVQYTRAGNFSLSADGTLVNARGMPVAGDSGGSITIPADARNVYIDRTGAVSTDDGQVGQLMVVEFANYQALDPAGNGLYRTDAAAIPAAQTRVAQGKLEGSNVQAVVEMTRMIDVHREYEAVARMTQSEHDRQRNAIQKLLQSS